MRPAARLAALDGYAFDTLDRLRAAREAAGADVIDFGVGDPTEATPSIVVEAAREGLRRHRQAGYPDYHGGRDFRGQVARWFRERHGVTLDDEHQIASTVGAKEAVFHLPQAFVDPGTYALVPSPGYPPYSRGTLLAGGEVVTYAVAAEGPVLPDLTTLPVEVVDKLRVVWITQPHVPTGRFASRDELTALAEQCRQRGILLCSDEAYSELWFAEPPPSALETGLDHVLVFQSLSKRSAMTGYRVGFVCGDAEALSHFCRLKMNIDSGTPQFVQDAAIAALGDEQAPADARRSYAERMDALLPALQHIGCQVERPGAGLYLWVGTPDRSSGVDFARRLLEESPALVVMPGEWLADPVPGLSVQPGDGRVRFAMVPSLDRCREASERLLAW